MVIVLQSDAGAAELDEVVRTVEAAGGTPFVSRGVARTIVGVIGDEPILAQLEALVLPGVADIIRVTSPYKLVSREHRAARTVVEVGPPGLTVSIGPHTLTLIAGPCAVETPEQTLEAARMAKAAGARLLRGGAYKPRTSPYAFQGLGEAGLHILVRRPCRDRAARRHRSRRRARRRSRRRARRHAPGRHPQHAELRVAPGGRFRRQARPAQARA